MINKKMTKLLVQTAVCLCFSVQAFGSARSLSLSSFQSAWSGTLKEHKTPEFFTRLTTKPSEGPSYFVANLSKPISFKNHFIRVKLRISDLQALAGIELRLSSDEANLQNFYKISVPIYGDPEFNILQSNQWAEVTLTLGESQIVGTPDLEKIRHIGFYIGGKTDSAKPLEIDFKRIEAEESITGAVLSMTFDDGYDDHYAAAKIMAKYGLRGTAYVMTNEIGKDTYLSQKELVSLKRDYHWSISAHHVTPITDPTMDLSGEMDNTLKYLSELSVGDEAYHFAYPLGKQSRQNTLPYIRETFHTARVAGGGAETLPPSDWHMLRTYNVTPDKSPEEIAARIAKAQKHNEWLILMFHFFSKDQPKNELTYEYKKFEKLCEHISKSKIRVHPVNEVYEAIKWK